MINLRGKDDLAGEALHFLRLSGTFYCRSEFTAPRAMELPAFKDNLMLHVVTAGQYFLEVDGNDTCLLKLGENLSSVGHN